MSTPGISRDQRISKEGLQRLRRQLESGTQISPAVLQQWINRYGQPVIDLLGEFGVTLPENPAGSD